MTKPLYDNTGGPSPDKRVSGYLAKLPWPAGEFNREYEWPRDDPRAKLVARLNHTNPEGWVMVKADELEAVCWLRTCRSVRVIDRDGPPRAFHCILEAGHDKRHTNGYHSWDAEPIADEATILAQAGYSV